MTNQCSGAHGETLEPRNRINYPGNYPICTGFARSDWLPRLTVQDVGYRQVILGFFLPPRKSPHKPRCIYRVSFTNFMIGVLCSVVIAGVCRASSERLLAHSLIISSPLTLQTLLVVLRKPRDHLADEYRVPGGATHTSRIRPPPSSAATAEDPEI